MTYTSWIWKSLVSVLLFIPGSIAQAQSCPSGTCTGEASNCKPIANAGPSSRSGNVGVALSFDGSASFDPSGGAVTQYWWNFGNGQFTGWQSSAVVSHTYLNPGTYSLRLWAKDSSNSACFSDSALVTVTISSGSNPCSGNSAPIANAGADQSGTVNVALSFSAASSSDPGGSISSYAWNFGDGSSASGVSASKSYASAGTYTVTLTVTDNCGATASDSAVVTIASVPPPPPCSNNQAPTANAGPDRQGNTGAALLFSGTLSTDPNNNIVDYWWNFGDGQYTSWIQNASVSHTYANAGTFSARLWVRDSCGSMSASDTAIVTISSGSNPCANNVAPVANAGPDKTGNPGVAIVFSGSGSDSNGTISSYLWNFGDGSTSNLALSSKVYANAGNYVATLTVTDNCGASHTDSASVSIQNINQAPTVNAGADQSFTMPLSGSGSITLNGFVSDDGLPAGSMVTKTWSKVSGPGSVTFANPNSAITTASISAAGSYLLRLTASDGSLSSLDELIVVANPNACAGNQNPTANAGPDKTGTVGVALSFSGSLSSDPNGTIQSYAWNFGDGTNGSGMSVSKTYSTAGNYTVTLTVTDICNATGTDTALVTVQNQNQAPIVNAGPNQTVSLNATGFVTVNLSGSVSDDGLPAGANVTQLWSKISGPGIVSIANNAAPVTTASINAAGTYVLRLTANDTQLSNFAELQIVVNPFNPCAGNTPPIANSGPDKTGSVGAAISFAGTATDSNGSITAYSWNFGDGSALVSGPNASHIYNSAGTFTASLTVTDNCNATHTDTALVTISSGGGGQVVANFSVSRLVSTNPFTGEQQWQLVNVPTEIVHEGTTLKFDASSSTGPVSFVSWMFGDGGFEVGEVVYHLYAGTGSFNAELTVYDPAWVAPDSLTKAITINRAMVFMDALGLADDSSMDIAVWGSYAYTTHSTGLLTTINISSPTNIQIANEITAPIGRAIATSNGHVYVGASSLGLSTFTATATPVLVNTYNTNTTDGQSVRDLMAAGKVVFMAAGPTGLKIMNMSNPASPVVLASRLLPNSATAEVIYVTGGRAYIADTSKNVHIYDVSMINVDAPAAASPILLSTISLSWNVHQLALSGTTLVAQANPGGMHLYDISNVSSPVFITNYDFSHDAGGLSPGGILAVGNTLYATMGQVIGIGTSVARVNLANPAEPYIMEWLSLNGVVAGINRGPFLHNGLLFMANSKYKAVVIDIPE